MSNLSLNVVIRAVTDQFTAAVNGARASLTDLANGAERSSSTLGGFHNRINGLSRSVLDFAGTLRSMASGFSILALAFGTKELIQFADSLRLIEGRVKNASSGIADFKANYAALVGISMRSGTSFAENAQMFSRINAGVLAMGGTSQDTLRQVDLLAKGLVVSGAGAAESASTIRQWSQAMASGLLRGDEFNSIMENSPRIAKALSDALHVNIGVLRTMAEAGELTAAKVAAALASQGKVIDAEYQKMPVSIGMAFEKIRTAFGQYVADADKGAGATHGIATSMEALAHNMTAVIGTLVTAGKITAVIFAGAALGSISAYLAAQWRVNQATRALIAMTSAHAEALMMDLQRTVALTTARVAQVQADIAATQATLAGTLSMGARMAATNTLNLQTQALTAATLAQTEANAALSASSWTLAGALKALPFAALNVAMAATVGYMLGDWLNGFKEVRKGALIAIDGIVSAFAWVEHAAQKAAIYLSFKPKTGEEGWKKLQQAVADLDAQYAAGKQVRADTLESLLNEADANQAVADALDVNAKSLENLKTPAETFKEKAKALTEEFNKQGKAAKENALNLETYKNTLLSLHTAMQADIEKNKTPFEKEKDKLEDKAFAQSHTPAETQRREYLKTNTAEETDALMVLWEKTKEGQQEVAKDAKALTKETLDAKLSAIKTHQDALKTANEYDLKQVANTYAAKELDLKQQYNTELITKQQLDSQLLDLERAKSTEELDIKRKLTAQTTQLELDAINAKIQAAQASNGGNYDDLINAATQKHNLPDGLVRAVMQRESSGNPNAVSSAGAQGLMGLMPNTAKGLGVTDSFDPEQNIEAGARYLKQMLVAFKGDMNAALMAYNAGETGVKRVKGDYSKLEKETQQYPGLVKDEMQTPTGNASLADNVKLKALYAEREAIQAEALAASKSLGQEEQANALEQSDAELQIKKAAFDQQKQLDEEAANASHDAALSEIDAKATASEQELALGNITQEQHLANLRDFASQRLAIELDLLDAKRALLGEDKLALAQNLHAKEALVRGYNATQKGLDNKEAQDKKAAFKSMFQPFETAMDGMVQGVLTGQQSIGKAVKNAAASILTSYAATFIKARIMNAAEWAWEVAGFGTKEGKKKAIENGTEVWHALLWVKKKALMVGHWLWETLGFAGKETAKTGIAATSEGVQTGLKVTAETAKAGAVIVGEAIQTGAVATGESARQSITFMGAIKTIGVKAAQAAAGAFSWVMTEVPWPLNIILAPLAAVAAFAGTMAFGAFSSKGGEWQVGKDGSPYILHANETVLPAGVADNFRHVVNLVQGTVAPVEPINDTITRLLNNGQIPKQLGLPDHALRLTSTVQTAANNLAKERSNADKERQSIVNTKQEATTINMHGIMLSPEDFLEKHGKTIVKVAQKQARNFNTGKKS